MDKSQAVLGDIEEQKIETKRLSEEAIAPKVVQEVEESKGSPSSDIQGNLYTLKDLSSPYPAKRCVLIVPPLYLDHDILRKLTEKNEEKSLEYKWKETGSKGSKGDSIIVLCKSLQIKDKFLVGANTFFVFAGFDKETKRATVRKLESVVEAEDTSQYREQAAAFIASGNKQKTLDYFWNNVKTFLQTLAKELPNNYCEFNLSKAEHIVDKVDFAFEKLADIQATLTKEQIRAVRATISKARGRTEKTETTERKKALFLIPIGMPGMGKTTFLNIISQQLEEKGCAVTVISSDKIRKQHMEEAMQEDSDLTEDDAFDKVGSDSRYKFFDAVGDAIQKTDSLPQMTHVILLDKNHVPQIVGETLNYIYRLRIKTNSKCSIKTVVINPLCTAGFQNQTSTFPFSLTFFLTCLHRAARRKDHETMKGTNIRAAQVVLHFFKEYRNYRTAESDLRALKVNFLLEMPFTHEDVEAEKKLPESLIKSFNALVDTVEEPEEEKIVGFLNGLEKSGFEPKNQDIAMISETVLDGLNRTFKLF